MNKNLFYKELRKNAPGLAIWIFVIAVLISLTMSMYHTFIENQAQVMGMMNIIPKGALQIKGISNFEDLLSVLGFYATNNTIYMMLLGSIFAIVLSSNILLKEEYQKTAEYLLSKPISRSEVFMSKLAVLNLNILLLNISTAIVGFICIELVKNGQFSFKPFAILSIYTLLLNLLFGAIGLFISTLVKRSKPITTLSIGLVLILYFIYTLSKITPNTAKIGYLSPFKYANIEVLNSSYGLDFWNLLFFIGFTVVLTFVSFQIYRKKDIYL